MTTSDDARALKSEVAAAQVVIDKLNARLTQKTNQLQIIQTIASGINATLDLDEIIQTSLESLDALFGFRHAMIAFADDASQSLEVAASRGYDGAGIGARVAYGKGVLGMVAKKRKIVRMVGLRAARLYASVAGGGANHVPLPGLADAQSQLAIPLVVKDRLIGVYAVESPESNAFDAVDELILDILTKQLAAAIDNARAYDLQTRMKEVYARYVPTEFLACLGRSSILDVQRGDYVEREMSILFSDMRSFTSIVEGNSREENFAFINLYFSRLEQAIRDAGGFVDSYEGDAVMALFPGARTETVADEAVRAGIAMFRALERFNDERASEGKTRISIGVGVNTGPLTLGTIGSVDRMKCGVIGDPVNLAARIEGMTKRYGAAMLVSEATRDGLTDPSAYSLRRVDRVRVKGKSLAVTVFEVLDALPPAARAPREAVLARFAEARALFLDRQLEGALQAFEALEASHPSETAARDYIEECRDLLVARIPDDWDGVIALTSK